MRHLAYTLVTNNTQNAISGMTDGHTLRHASAVKHVKLAQSPPFSQIKTQCLEIINCHAYILQNFFYNI